MGPHNVGKGRKGKGVFLLEKSLSKVRGGGGKKKRTDGKYKQWGHEKKPPPPRDLESYEGGKGDRALHKIPSKQEREGAQSKSDPPRGLSFRPLERL